MSDAVIKKKKQMILHQNILRCRCRYADTVHRARRLQPFWRYFGQRRWERWSRMWEVVWVMVQWYFLCAGKVVTLSVSLKHVGHLLWISRRTAQVYPSQFFSCGLNNSFPHLRVFLFFFVPCSRLLPPQVCSYLLCSPGSGLHVCDLRLIARPTCSALRVAAEFSPLSSSPTRWDRWPAHSLISFLVSKGSFADWRRVNAELLFLFVMK